MEKEYYARRAAMRGVSNEFLVYRAYLWFLGLSAIVVGAIAAYGGGSFAIAGASIGGGLLACFLAHELRLAKEWARLTAGVLCALAALASAVWLVSGWIGALSEKGGIGHTLMFTVGAIALLHPATARRFRAARTAIVEAEAAKQHAAAQRVNRRAS